jgi:hypothetical protein
MRRIHRTTIAIAVLLMSAVATIGLAAQDRYALKALNGISFAEIRGYETWQVIQPDRVKDSVKAILGNPAMIKAYQDGIPQNGKPFPDGAKVVKIEWSTKPHAAEHDALVPDTLRTVSLIIKDSKRFPETSGWGYAQFVYDAKSDSFKPFGDDASFGKTVCFKCHTKVQATDYIFTAYPKR